MDHRRSNEETHGNSRKRQSPRPPVSSSSSPLTHHSASLIPEQIIDHASQRLTIASVFFAIQAWKIYDILLIKADAYAVSGAVVGTSINSSFLLLNNFTFVLKYALVDGLFLWLLPMLNVPFLSFSPAFTLLLTVLINSGNFLLTSHSAVPLLSSIFVPIWNFFFRQRELTIVGDSVPSGNGVEVNSHFRGRYTIQYLPESSVTLNPFRFGGMCLENADSSTFSSLIKVPIEFNTTSEVGSMQIEHVSPMNVRTLLNYTRSDFKKLTKIDSSRYTQYSNFVSNDDRVFYAEVDVSAPGRYRIARVTDVDGLVIRSYKSDFTVGACPVAKFTYPAAELDYTKHVCLTKDAALLNWSLPLVDATGLMPMTVEINSFLNGKSLSTFNATLGDKIVERKGLGWLHALKILRNAVEQEILRSQPNLSAGILQFHINSITDAAGVSRLYNPASRDKDVDFSVQLKSSAKLKLIDPAPQLLLTNKRMKKLRLESDTAVSYPLTFSVELFPKEKSTPIYTNYTLRNSEEFRAGIEVSQEGAYQLHAGQDRYCPCLISDNEPILLSKPNLPTVHILEKPITDKCVGTIGYEFDLSFTGTGPFEVSYEVYKNISNVMKPVLSERGLKEHKRRTSDAKFNFQYLPTQEGNYKLVFKGIRDANYNDELIRISEDENTFITYISKRSSFTFFKNTHVRHKTIKLCKAGIAKVPFYLEGNFPFSFTYELVSTKSSQVVHSETVKDYFDDTYTVQVPELKEGGEYKLRLKNVSDKLGCPAAGQALEQIQILARDDIPILGFEKAETNLVIVEGDTIKVPLSLKSSRGFTSGDKIVYKVVDLHNEHSSKTITVQASNDLHLSSEGIYSLESFSNNGCPGTISEEKSLIRVEYYSKPLLQLEPETMRVLSQKDNNFGLSPLCQKTASELKVKLTGQKPFDVQYVIQFPNGKTKTPLITIDNDELSVPLPSSQKGIYTVRFLNVYDSLYSREKLERLSYNMPTQLVSYEIQGAPNIFTEKKYLQICETQVNEAGLLRVPVSLEGVAPFKISGRIIHDLTSKVENFNYENVNGKTINLADGGFSQNLDKILTVGEHMIIFDTIEDSNGCKRENLGEESQIKLSVTQIPTISKTSTKNYCCVGDYISYNMSGIAPFKVYYDFNGKARRAESGPKFVRLALKPGHLSITALQDSSAGLCMVNFTRSPLEYKQLELNVYDLPSVEISHGDNLIKNLHEGDQTEISFKFAGMPPFLVTYVRTISEMKRSKGSKDKGPKKVVETKTIDNIWDFEHTEVVSLEGTYDAIRVSDAYCQAERDISEILHN